MHRRIVSAHQGSDRSVDDLLLFYPAESIEDFGPHANFEVSDPAGGNLNLGIGNSLKDRTPQSRCDFRWTVESLDLQVLPVGWLENPIRKTQPLTSVFLEFF